MKKSNWITSIVAVGAIALSTLPAAASELPILLLSPEEINTQTPIDRSGQTANSIVAKTVAATYQEQKAVKDYWTTSRMGATYLTSNNFLDFIKNTPTITSKEAHTTSTQSKLKGVKNATNTSRKAQPWNKNGAVTKTVGRIFFTLSGRDYTCTGTAVDSKNQSTVITAGHCINAGPGEFAQNWVFIPEYHTGSEPHGRWTAHKLFTTAAWSQRGELDSDIGFAVLNKHNGRRLIETVGSQEIGFNKAAGQYVYAFGYPALSPYDGNTLYLCEGQPHPDPYGKARQGIDCDMTEGSSGGPWFTHFDSATGNGTITSVNSFSYSDDLNTMLGPDFNETTRELYNHAQEI